MADPEENGSGPAPGDDEVTPADGTAGAQTGDAFSQVEGHRANYRRIFEQELRSLPAELRMAMAQEASGALLSALCLDPVPKVIQVVLENALTGLDQARLIAAHHGNPVGLEALAAHSAFLRDEVVRRMLLRNAQAPETALRKLLAPCNLVQLFKLTVSRENTERAKRASRDGLRRRFLQVGGEECAGLILTTEGRCLPMLIGLQFDGKTTALLCRRTFASTLLIQNLARFPGTPPAILKHLLGQPLVRRTPHLRQLLLQHSNCPTEAKRKE